MNKFGKDVDPRIMYLYEPIVTEEKQKKKCISMIVTKCCGVQKNQLHFTAIRTALIFPTGNLVKFHL